MNLLVTTPLREEDLELLRTKFDNLTYQPWTLIGTGYDAKTVLNMLKETKADAFISELDDVSREVLDAYHSLLFIGDCRAAPVNIDLEAATKYNIPILNTPARNAQAVAELLVGLLVCFMRNVGPSVEWAKEGSWLPGEVPYHRFMGNEICGKRIGFVGFGAVAQITAKILASFGADIYYYDPYVTPENDTYTPRGLDKLFSESDIVSLHLPVLDSTKGMIDAKLLSSMKKDAIFVNTARSAVLDGDKLLELLKKGAIKGAVIDVFDKEPPGEKELELIRLPNVLATPHICGATYEVTDHQSRIITQNILKWFEKKDLDRIVFNKEVLKEGN